MLALRVVGHEFKPQSDQTKDYIIGFSTPGELCFFSKKNILILVVEKK
jgi:hypothetical protein